MQQCSFIVCLRQLACLKLLTEISLQKPALQKTPPELNRGGVLATRLAASCGRLGIYLRFSQSFA